jgi:hypothetical protein
MSREEVVAPIDLQTLRPLPWSPSLVSRPLGPVSPSCSARSRPSSSPWTSVLWAAQLMYLSRLPELFCRTGLLLSAAMELMPRRFPTSRVRVQPIAWRSKWTPSWRRDTHHRKRCPIATMNLSCFLLVLAFLRRPGNCNYLHTRSSLTPRQSMRFHSRAP